MVSHWGLSYNKSSQVSRSLLSILADLNNAVVVMVSTRPLISKTAIPCTNPLVTVPRPPITVGITVTFMFHSLFSSLERSRYLSLFFFFFFFFFCFPSVLPCGHPKRQSPQFYSFVFCFFCFVFFTFFFCFFVCLFVCLFFTITRSGNLAENRWSVCISKSVSFVRLIFLDGLLVLHIPFVRMVKFKLLAQFPVDHLPHPIVSSFILFLC